MQTYPSDPKPFYSYVMEREYKTYVSDFQSGKEQRRSIWRFPKRMFVLLYKALAMTDAERNIISDFIERRRGPYEPFWFFDFIKRKWIDQFVGYGDGTTTTFDLPSKNTDPTTVKVYVGGSEKSIIEVKNSTGSTFNRGDFTNGNAFFWSSINLSPYAGTDTGYTPYMIELTDLTGKKATGYIGAVGAGLTLGSESITNGGMEDGNPPTGWFNKPWGLLEIFERSDIQKRSGSYSCRGVDSIPNWGGFNGHPIMLYGALYKLEYWYYLVSGANVAVALWDAATKLLFQKFYTTTGSWQYDEGFMTETTGGTVMLQFYNHSDSVPNEFFIDDVSLRRVLEPPATAVHIVSSLNGTTRNWASIESGFNLNRITSWKIFGRPWKVLLGGGQGGADRIQFLTDIPTTWQLITADFNGQLRIKGRFKDDKFSEEIFSLDYTNISVNIYEVK